MATNMTETPNTPAAPTPTPEPSMNPMSTAAPSMGLMFAVMFVLLVAVGAAAYYFGLVQGRTEVITPIEVQETSPLPTATEAPSPTLTISPTPTDVMEKENGDAMESPTPTVDANLNITY